MTDRIGVRVDDWPVQTAIIIAFSRITTAARATKAVAKATGRAFTRLLDSESVRLFVWPFYLSLLLWGVYASIWAWPSSVVEPVMGTSAYLVWVWMFIPGTLFVMIGLVLRRGGKPLAEMGVVMLFSDYLGLWMQRGGHICMGILLGMYEAAVIAGGFWGQPLFSFFAIAPYVLGCGFLALQTHRKIRHGVVLHRRGPEGLP